MKHEIETIDIDAEAETLLTAAALPIADLRDARETTFFGVRDAGRLVAITGVEVHGDVGLLRSLAVDQDRRGGGLGHALVLYAEEWSRRRGLSALYLMTTTAEAFFARLGYKTIPRSAAPERIAGSAQFAGLCPESSAFMRKFLVASGA